TSGEALPSVYTWTVRLSTNAEQDAGLGYLHVNIEPAGVSIEGTEQEGGTAFAYGLYDKEESAFTLSVSEEVKIGAEWYLPPTDFVKIREGKIVFDAGVSEGKGEEETVIN